jgi:hypothetical protein
MTTSYMARCGSSERHHAHVFTRENGRLAVCVGNDAERIIARSVDASALFIPPYARRFTQDGPRVAIKVYQARSEE